MALLDVQNLNISVATETGFLPVVENLSFVLEAGETLGIVGESGCGKSLTSLAIMGLLPHPQVQVTGGVIRFEGEDLVSMAPARRRHIMGRRLAMIFQEPMTSLNPVYTVGDQIIEAIQQHNPSSRKAARERAVKLLHEVGIPDPGSRIDAYPHQLSGGMRQRVMIAMSLSCEPVLLIADEPTTALDVTVQAQILELLSSLQKANGMGVVLISHDLGVIAEMTRQTLVMYRGRMVERASTGRVFDEPGHHYTKGLLNSLPDPDREVEELPSIPGFVPPLGEELPGCNFHPRCPAVQPRCKSEPPVGRELNSGHDVSCHFPNLRGNGAAMGGET